MMDWSFGGRSWLGRERGEEDEQKGVMKEGGFAEREGRASWDWGERKWVLLEMDLEQQRGSLGEKR